MKLVGSGHDPIGHDACNQPKGEGLSVNQCRLEELNKSFHSITPIEEEVSIDLDNRPKTDSYSRHHDCLGKTHVYVPQPTNLGSE